MGECMGGLDKSRFTDCLQQWKRRKSFYLDSFVSQVEPEFFSFSRHVLSVFDWSGDISGYPYQPRKISGIESDWSGKVCRKDES